MTLLAIYRPEPYPSIGVELSFTVTRDGVEIASGTTVDDGAMVWKNIETDINRVDTDVITLTMLDNTTRTFNVGNRLHIG